MGGRGARKSSSADLTLAGRVRFARSFRLPIVACIPARCPSCLAIALAGQWRTRSVREHECPACEAGRFVSVETSVEELAAPSRTVLTEQAGWTVREGIEADSMLWVESVLERDVAARLAALRGERELAELGSLTEQTRSELAAIVGANGHAG